MGRIWNAIEKDEHKAYDALVKIVKDTLAGDNNELAYEVEDAFNALFVEVMEKLETKY